MADDQRKRRGRSKSLRSCFRPLPAGEGHSSSDKLDGRNNGNGQFGKAVLIAVSGRNGKGFVQDVHLVNGGGVADIGVDCHAKSKRRSPRRRFSRILKAVLFDSLMVKKIRRSSSKSSMASDTSLSFSSTEKIRKSAIDSKECTDMDDSCSRRSDLLSSSSRTTSSSLSSSSSSSVNSNSRWLSDQKPSSRIDSDDLNLVSSNLSISKNLNPSNTSSRSFLDQKVSSRTDSLDLKRQDSSISLPPARPYPLISISKSSSIQTGLSQLDSRKANPDKIKSGGSTNNWNLQWCFFILLSLIVLIIWGRIFSILCTSTWFFFVPRRRIKRVNSVTNSAEFLDIDSVQYRKRVIMAGLLERTRNPVR